MGADTGLDASLRAVEIDLLCTFAEVAPPFPLRVGSFGQTLDERRAVFRDARAALADRGLADHRGPCGVAATFVRLLRDSPLALDLVLTVRDQRTGAVVLAGRDEALVAVQHFDEPGGAVALAAIGVDEAIDELLYLVPDLDAAMTTPFTLPRKSLGRVNAALLDRARAPGAVPMSTAEVDALLAEHGIDERLAHRLLTQLQPVLGNGQSGLAARAGYAQEWRRVGEEFQWLDTERGRFRLAADPTGAWMSVNPLFTHELHTAIRQLAGSLRAAPDQPDRLNGLLPGVDSIRYRDHRIR